MKPAYLIVALTALTVTPALRASPTGTAEDAIDVLDDLAATPEKRVPPALLKDAAAVIVAPDVIRGGLVVGARHGHGILLVRKKDGWSDPVFVKLTGGSVGWQAGVQSTDLFLVVRNGRSLDRIFRGAGKLTLGADASVAAGPIGREAGAGTDAALKAEILSYSRTRGLFAGVALDGDTVLVDHAANDRFYGKRKVAVGEIIAGKVDAPKVAGELRARLAEWSGDVTAPRPAPPPVTPAARIELPKKP
ncbi:MAG TPA: lipid-binding SYLF domain-containing protein [Gemmataceae bacterium]|nr:lipid-binding SYLF domain-containing protein [Gemmataceae bacterium]